jgi:threonine synthase
MSNVLFLKCQNCLKEYQKTAIDYTCPDCGPLLGTLEVVYDYDQIAKTFSRENLRNDNHFNHWRYLPVLPIENPEYIQPLEVGWTPVYKLNKTAGVLGVNSLWVKDDGRNPTASFKDRASSVAVVKALEKKSKTLTAASTGNAASSLSAFTALAGLETIIFVPRDAPQAKIAQLLLYGAKIFQVNGNYDDAFDLCCQAAEKWGWYNRSTAINPYLGEGKKTAALEICEQLNWKIPDYVFVAVGDGCILQGTWKGFKDFYKTGLIDKLPKIVGVQAEGAAPLYHAWKKGLDQCEVIIPETLADSISVGFPRDQAKALKAVRESGGEFVSVPDSEILQAISFLARNAGVFAEPAGATAFAGFKKLAEKLQNKDVVVMVTGNGLKDIKGVMKAVNSQPVLIENDINEVEKNYR